MFKYFDRYVLKEIAPPFFIGLLLCSFVLLMNQILVLSDLFIAQGVSFFLAVKILFYLVPSLLAFAVPMAVLMGILAGMSRLSTDSEITAMRTLGIGSGRLSRPLFLFAFAGWLATSFLAMFLAPWANYQFVKTATGSVMAKVQFKINPREFNESIPNMVIFLQDVEQDKTWKNVFVYLKDKPSEPRIILAKKGKLNLYPEMKEAVLELWDGTMHSCPLRKPEEYRTTSFGYQTEVIDVSHAFPSMESRKRVREKDFFELLDGVRELRGELAASVSPEPAGTKADPARAGLQMMPEAVKNGSKPGLKTGAGKKTAMRRGGKPEEEVKAVFLRTREDKMRDFRAHWVEIHKKFSLPFVCFIFVVIGLPLGVTTRKGGRTSGFTISIVIILLYYILLTAGEKMAMDGRVSPLLGIWSANILLALAGIVLFVRTLRESALFPGFRRLEIRRRVFRAVADKRATRKGRPRIFLKFPNILDRYIGRKFLFLFGLIFAGLLAVSLIVTFFERIDNVYAHDKPLAMFMQYLWYRIPDFISFILPVAGLMATLLVLGIMEKFNEVTAMKACGISIYRMVLPILFLASCVSLGSFYIQDRILPPAAGKADEIWNRINDNPSRRYSDINRHWILGKERNRIYHYDSLDKVSSKFTSISIFDIDLESWSLKKRLFADKAVLSEDYLDLSGGWGRAFSGDRTESFDPMKDLRLPAIEGRSYFTKDEKDPAQMTFAMLRRHVAELQSQGLEATRFKMTLHAKISFPVICFIMSLLGIPFSFSMGKKGALVGIGLGIIIAMVYWGAVAVLKSLGDGGFLPVFLAAWTPNIVFGLVGVSGILRLRT